MGTNAEQARPYLEQWAKTQYPEPKCDVYRTSWIPEPTRFEYVTLAVRDKSAAMKFLNDVPSMMRLLERLAWDNDYMAAKLGLAEGYAPAPK